MVHNSSHPDLHETLNNCLQAIETGQATVEDCVKEYPEFERLGDLLRAAMVVRELPTVALPPARKLELKEQLLARYRIRKEVRVEQPHRRMQRLKAALVGSMAAVGLMLGSVGLVHASELAIPGDTLYGLKRTVEQIEVSLADMQSRPAVLYHLAEVRLEEVDVLASRGQRISKTVAVDVIQGLTSALSVQPDPAQRNVLIGKAERILEVAQLRGAIDADTESTVLAAILAVPAPISASSKQPTDAATPGDAATTLGGSTVPLQPHTPPTSTPIGKQLKKTTSGVRGGLNPPSGNPHLGGTPNGNPHPGGGKK